MEGVCAPAARACHADNVHILPVETPRTFRGAHRSLPVHRQAPARATHLPIPFQVRHQAQARKRQLKAVLSPTLHALSRQKHSSHTLLQSGTCLATAFPLGHLHVQDLSCKCRSSPARYGRRRIRRRAAEETGGVTAEESKFKYSNFEPSLSL